MPSRARPVRQGRRKCHSMSGSGPRRSDTGSMHGRGPRVEAGSLVAELKRRRVFRALVGYGIAAFAVLQIIEPIMHGLHWPDAVLSYVVAALAVGFPLVVTLAWIFDVKAGRIERTVSTPAAGPKGVRLGLVLVGIGVLAAAPGVVWYFVVRGTPRPVPASVAGAPPTTPSIAVLPFADMSPGKDQEYFSDGIAEEILDNLAQVEGLRVIGRTSSFSFKGKNEDLRAISEKLGVAHILEGSVRKEGSRVPITAQLIEASGGSHVWSRTFDRELTGIFVVQDEIAKAVVGALSVKLLPGMGAPTNEARTENPEAYKHFLLGRHFHDRVSQEGLQLAVDEYRKAIALDPRYAAAHAWLSTALCDQAGNAQTVAAAAELRRTAIDAAEQAVALGPNLPVALSARTLVRTKLSWDWKGAMADASRALAINPADPPSLRRTGILVACLGRFDEAITHLRKSVEIDPLLATSWNWLGVVQSNAGRLDEARDAMKRALQIAPDSDDPKVGLASLLLLEGNPAAALNASRSLLDEGDRLWFAAIAEHELGHLADSQKALDELASKVADVDPSVIADVFAWRGDGDHAFEWLDRAFDQRASGLHMIKLDLAFRKLRGDPRFTAFLRKMKLPVD